MSALTDLIASVHDGRWPDDGSPLLALGRNAHATIDAERAFHGSVDAALSLKNDLLTTWALDRLGQRWGGVWEAILLETSEGGWHRKETDLRSNQWSDTAARALLLATLNALEQAANKPALVQNSAKQGAA